MPRIGDFELGRIVESEVPLLPAAEFFPESTPDVFEANADWLQPTHVDPATGLLVLCMQSYVVRTGRHTILVDGCVGEDKPRPERPSWHEKKWPTYHAGMRTLNLRPEEIDYVLCTHLHTDHVGWNTKLENGRWVPTFPNAKYIFARKEYAFWEARNRQGIATGHPAAFLDSVLPVMEAGRAVLVEMDHQIEDGVWFEPAPGHTEGNVVVNLQSHGHKAVLCGDVVHHPVQLVRPDWSSRACEDRAMSRVSRRKLLESIADTGTLLAPAHFASPSIGRVVRSGDAFRYRT